MKKRLLHTLNFVLLIYVCDAQTVFNQSGDLSQTFGNNVAIHDMASYNGNLFAVGTGLEGIFRSDDDGDTWTILDNATNGVPNASSINYNTVEVIGTRIYIGQTSNGNGDIYYSDDNGDTWTADTTGLPKGLIGLPRLHVHEMWTNQGKLFVRLDGVNNFYKKAPSDASWTKLETFTVATSDFISVNDTMWGNTSAGIAYSTDEGATWVEPANAGIPLNGFGSAPAATQGFAYMNGTFYAGTQDFFSLPQNLGVFKTTDGGENWTIEGYNDSILDVDPMWEMFPSSQGLFGFAGANSPSTVLEAKNVNPGLSFTEVSGISATPISFLENNGKLYVGTTAGIFVHDTGGGTTGITAENWNKSISIYPNPTTEYINLTIDNYQGGWKFELYTIDGKQVIQKELVLSNSKFDVSSLSPGTYVYTIKDKKSVAVDTKELLIY